MRLGILLIFLMLSLNLAITVVNVVPGVNPFADYSSFPNSTNTYDETLNEGAVNDTMSGGGGLIDFFSAPISGFFMLTDTIKNILFGAPALCLTIADQVFPSTDLVNYNGVSMSVNQFLVSMVFIIIYLIMIITLIEVLTGREIIGL